MTEKRKMLMIIFTDDGCKLNHAFMYAKDLDSKGHQIKLLLEGTATKSLRNLENKDSMFTKLFYEIKEKNILIGACERASNGCSEPGGEANVVEIAKAQKVELVAGMNGHADISSFVEQGYELVIF